MTYQEALYKIFEGNCLLILGSGFSCGCEIARGNQMPRADQLCSILDTHSGEESGGDLGLSAELYIEKKGESSLCALLKEQFTPINLGDDHKTIAGENWRRIYTTNYDDIIEHGARLVKKERIEGVTLSTDPTTINNKKNIVVHLNGHLSNLSPHTLCDEFKLTKASYLMDNFKKSRWMDLFDLDLKDSDAIFIVGLSLDYDLDIARAVFREEDKDKIFIIAWEDEKPWNIKKLSKFGNILGIGRNQFANDIISSKKDYVPPVYTKSVSFTSFKTVELVKDRPNISDETIRGLLLWGQVDTASLQFSITEPDKYHYYIYRERLDSALNLINNGVNNIVVDSSVGNGKTMFIKGLSVRLVQFGYRVFILHRENDHTVQELEAICAIPDKRTVLIIENYSKYKYLIDVIAALRSDTALILTERTAINDIHYDWLTEKFGNEFHQINLNRLTQKEIDSTIELIDYVNLWGELAANKLHKKQRFIEKDCKSELRSLLLKIFDTKPVKDHLSEIFKNIETSNFKKTTILLLMANYASFNIDLYDLSKVINDDVITSTAFQRNHVIREFLDFSTGECKATSSLLAEYILKNFVDPQSLCNTLIEAFKDFDRNTYKYANVLKSLCKHSTLLSLIGHHSEEAKKLIPEYYDKIKNCKWCRNNAHFWLQYAIAMLDQLAYTEALLYFKNAYAYANDDKFFNKMQIDNHFARYLLENAVRNNDEQFWESFNQAHRILTDPRYLKDKKYYPFKVGILYEPFYKKYKKDMDLSKIKQFKEKSDQLLKMLENYEKTASTHRKDVVEAQKGLQAILRDRSALKIK